MEDNNQILTQKDYIAALQREKDATDPRVLRAYELQERMQHAKKQYEDLKEEFHKLLGQVGPYKNEYYSVSNLKRAPRRVDMPLFRKNFPDLVEKAEPSEKYIIQALIEEFGKDTLLRMARDHDPEAYDEARTMSIAEFDKLTGDSPKLYKYAGVAYQERWIEDKSEPLSITYIGKPLIREFRGRHPKQLQTADDMSEEEYDALQAEAATIAEAQAMDEYVSDIAGAMGGVL